MQRRGAGGAAREAALHGGQGGSDGCTDGHVRQPAVVARECARVCVAQHDVQVVARKLEHYLQQVVHCALHLLVAHHQLRGARLDEAALVRHEVVEGEGLVVGQVHQAGG